MSIRNDLWIVEFSNNDPSVEVLIQPEIVARLGTDLNRFFRAAIPMLWVEGPAPQAEMLLAGVERGSLRLGLFPALRAHKDDISVAANLTTIAMALVVALQAAGAIPANGAHEQADEPHELAHRVAADPAAASAATHIVRIAEEAGVDTVTLSVPGCPTLALLSEHSRDVGLIGRRALGAITPSDFVGTLTNIHGPLRLTSIVEGDRDLYWGTIDNKGRHSVVLIDWKLKKPLDAAADEGELVVRGRLGGFDLREFRSAEPIPEALKSAVGMLTVEGRFVSD